MCLNFLLPKLLMRMLMPFCAPFRTCSILENNLQHAVLLTPLQSIRPSVALAAFSEENMSILKQSVLEYTFFLDMDIANANATSQRDKFERLSAKMVQVLELPSLKLPLDIKLALKVIHSEISSLLANNVELKAKKTQYLRVINEKESLNQEFEKTKNTLNEISSKVVVEDSLMMSLTAEMKECSARPNFSFIFKL